MQEKPNVILILLDGVRLERTELLPEFKKLAQNGTYFGNSITYSPSTIPSMHAVLSGMNGRKNGVDNYFGTLQFRKDRVFTLAQYLKEKGYRTEAEIANKLIMPFQGFDNAVVHDYEKDAKQKAAHLQMLERLADAKQPFFVFYQFDEIRQILTKNVMKKFDDFSPELFENKEKNVRQYDEYLKDCDAYIREMWALIRRKGLDKNSLIIFFSDHGIGLGDRVGEKVYGSFCYDYTLRTFMLFISPDNRFPAKKIPSQVRLIDLMPTVLEYLGISAKSGFEKMDGESLLPLVEGREKGDRIAFSETGGLGGPTPSPKAPNVKSIRTGKWKLIYNSTLKKRELFDLENDPQEKENLSGKGLAIENELWEKLAGNT
ncbi:MAG: sulfatase-like hydrolase/transferase [Candidatus Diapherotrites archaeon]|nr:sulfatase-like hydrolase/transferase [Candidatus Diapherotrites archaeon]